ncbi:MAG: N-acetyltransferase [Deferribacteraceae bacterium]|jgi:amino-acid N-acetyltransferase|nr:N-acetyltransferase [Deferribacteraceae bacterium]
MNINLEKATMKDAPIIQELVNQFARKGQMLLISKNEIYEHLFEYLLCKVDGEAVGVCALRPVWEDKAEIRSLAVAPEHHRNGIGLAMIEKQLERARKYGFKQVFALTYREDFFKEAGFSLTTLEALPKKIWTDCLKCVKYPDCDETAVIIDL